MSDLETIFGVIRGFNFQVSDEDQLQAALAAVLADAGFVVEREHRLSPADRIDLLIDGHLGIEVKMSGSVNEVTRQIRRYTKHEKLDAVGLVTTRRAHRPITAIEFDKPVAVCVVGGYL